MTYRMDRVDGPLSVFNPHGKRNEQLETKRWHWIANSLRSRRIKKGERKPKQGNCETPSGGKIGEEGEYATIAGDVFRQSR